MTIHQVAGLRYSNGNSIEGLTLRNLCDDHVSCKLVKEPTRESYLLNLILSDLDNISVSVLPVITDHKAYSLPLSSLTLALSLSGEKIGILRMPPGTISSAACVISVG